MVDRNSHVPIYIQIEDIIKEKIAVGEYIKGSSIPSERELSETYNVSRMTVRQAITGLVNSGLLYREKGRGTFVADPKFEQPLNGLTGFTEDMIARGMEPSSDIVLFEKQLPSFEIKQDLGLNDEDEVYFIVRIRNADHLPMAIERTYIPAKLVPNLSKDQLSGSLYQLIEKEYGLDIHNATQQMEAAIVSKEDAKYLNVGQKAVVLIIKRTSYLSNGRPFELVRSVYRADRYKFISEITR
ncbi:GntR family transcriptional regulator [Rummeliibacillus stabekisii]|uniref:Phosphonate metabolism transcriptional regulator PhnF n=1 Tax=Rummeliibacillus stabekisii TaxID=241244 RepID=A0A143HAA7_9BACL|nr:GntR family transcriptional regulator [Rummeliibacillus stabekisii]AMW98667.1 phosphonate metabolism transcriptional regulator PhnF [Rummeliibacillus stabekisii]